MLMKLKPKTSLVKFIFISSFIFLGGCSVKDMAYSTLKSIFPPKCEQIVYQGDQVNCEINDRSNYNEYEKYEENNK